MPTIRLIVRYDGTAFHGWQRQRVQPTVQESLEIAIGAMTGERVNVAGAGRTDAGVHALAQVAGFRVGATIPEKGWRMGITSKLPPTVSVLDARVARDDFDPRRAAAGKRYRYLVHLGPSRDPLIRDRAWHVYGALDRGLMRREAEALVGTHDFDAFRAADCERLTAVRTVFRVALVEPWAGRDDLLAIEVEGTGFLKNMVRVIVGTLVDVGRGRLPEGTVRARLDDRDRTRSGVTAPPHGLYLDEVFVHPEWQLPDDVLRTRPAYAEAMIPRPAPRATPDPEDDE